MLKKISVRGFRNFRDWFLFDLETTKNYEFNSESIQDKLIKNSIVYGKNGCGKSNLGLAILDLTCHINDILVMTSLNQNYLNGDNDSGDIAEFIYEFKFGNDIVEYQYGKESAATTTYEVLKINGKEFISIDRRKSSKIVTHLSGTGTLNKDLSGSTISAVKYIKSNAVLDKRKRESGTFLKFIKFVSGMVFFRTLTQYADYHGQMTLDTPRLSKAIIEAGRLADFQDFLNEAGVTCKLNISGEGNEKRIVFKYKTHSVDFSLAASTGTLSLGIFYYWWLKLNSDDLAFAYIDEFDAYYHFALSKMVVKKLLKVNCQTILTTHNLSIMSNDLLRPDSYFILGEKQFPLYKLVDKDLRKAHNLEKIYKGLKYDS
jgi:AAA15 family ATPase/GTPase